MMISKKQKIQTFILLLAVFLVYFVTESFLRQAAVSHINPKAVDLDKIVTKLPSGMQQRVQYRIMITKLRAAVRKAVDAEERVQALSNLGTFTQDSKERDDAFRYILKNYPDHPVSYPAYIYFMLKKEPPEVDLKQFHKYQEKLPPTERYYAWTSAFNSFMEKKPVPGDEAVICFLEPILQIEPPFSEYYVLYRELMEKLRRVGKNSVSEKASDLADFCLTQKSFTEYLIFKEQQDEYIAKRVREKEKRVNR